MWSKTLWHGLGAPERAIMVPPSLGIVFKGWGMEEQELCLCPFLQIGVELGWFKRSSDLSLSTRINPLEWCSSQGKIPALPQGSGPSSCLFHVVVLIKLP